MFNVDHIFLTFWLVATFPVVQIVCDFDWDLDDIEVPTDLLVSSTSYVACKYSDVLPNLILLFCLSYAFLAIQLQPICSGKEWLSYSKAAHIPAFCYPMVWKILRCLCFYCMSMLKHLSTLRAKKLVLPRPLTGLYSNCFWTEFDAWAWVLIAIIWLCMLDGLT